MARCGQTLAIALDAVTLGIGYEILDKILVREEAIELLERCYALHSRTMAVCKLYRIAIERVVVPHLLVVLALTESVERNEDIGHNTTTTIYRTTLWRCELHRVVEAYRVGREELVVVVAVDDIEVVRHLVATRIRFLNRATSRREIARNGKTYGRAIGEWYLRLHQTLTKCAATNNQTSVVILNRTGQNLARRGTRLVDKYCQRKLLRTTLSIAALQLLLAATVYCIYYKFLVIEELVSKEYRLIEEASRVTTKVEDERTHTLLA